MKVIIDTDCGVDDAFALIAALNLYDVIAITCVSGNVHVDQVVNNVGVVLELANRIDIPFYKGCENFILNSWSRSTYEGHGLDGLGDSNMKSNLVPQEETAVNALIGLTKEHMDINLIAIGPLTNVALAILIYPDIVNRLQSFTIMGGAHQCKGNTGLASEFNIHCDPEAAKICLKHFPITRMLTWETSYNCHLPWKLWEQIQSSPNKYARFLTNISNKQMLQGGPGYIACDLIAVLSYLAEDASRSKDLFCDIELSGSLTRGATVFEWTDGVTEAKPNVRLLKMDINKILDIVTTIVLK